MAKRKEKVGGGGGGPQQPKKKKKKKADLLTEPLTKHFKRISGVSALKGAKKLSGLLFGTEKRPPGPKLPSQRKAEAISADKSRAVKHIKEQKRKAKIEAEAEKMLKGKKKKKRG